MATEKQGKAHKWKSARKELDQTCIEKLYACQYCKKGFRQSGDCKRHERIHTGEKPYTCKYCNKAFSRLAICKQHERTHTGEKPYTCQYCKKGFGQLQSCKRHERTHTGEKPYSCRHCKKCFSRSSVCRQHEQRHATDKFLTRHLQEPVTDSGQESDTLFSLTEENSSQVESLTCWICQEELSSETCLIQHYDDHMK